MKVLVLFAVLGACSAMPFLQDTPEVVAERARFFQLYNAAAAAAAAAPDDVSQQAAAEPVPRAVPVQSTNTIVGGWVGPVAATVPAGLPGSGNVVDTAEVQAATRAFELAYQQAVRATAPHLVQTRAAPVVVQPAAPVLNSIWTGPVAATIPAGLPGSGRVENTAEVQAAITAFQQAYNNAVAATTGLQPTVVAAPQPVAPQRWAGPLAATVPAGLPGSSNVMDTADVQAATAAFNAAFQQQLALTG